MVLKNADSLDEAILDGFMYSGSMIEKLSSKNPFYCIEQVDQTLKHYTMPNVIGLILNSGKLRLSKINGMRNDALEGNYVYDIFWRICRELLDEGKISESFYDSLKSNIHRQWLHTSSILGKTVECDVYSVCFTGLVDEEVLFERYGDCAIQFGPTIRLLTQYFTPTVKECAKLCKVLYTP